MIRLRLMWNDLLLLWFNYKLARELAPPTMRNLELVRAGLESLNIHLRYAQRDWLRQNNKKIMEGYERLRKLRSQLESRPGRR